MGVPQSTGPESDLDPPQNLEKDAEVIFLYASAAATRATEENGEEKAGTTQGRILHDGGTSRGVLEKITDGG